MSGVKNSLSSAWALGPIVMVRDLPRWAVLWCGGLYSQFSPPVDLDQLPPYVPAAFVAIEDKRFYEHNGYDVAGMARAIMADIGAGRAREGASTITQQLARNLFLNNDQNIRRKVQELILAVWLETKFSKKEILALYLNRVY